MKSIILVALALVAITAAAPVDEPPKTVKIVRSDFEQQPNGAYVYAAEGEDGNVHEETGEVKEVTDEENKVHSVVVVRGTYQYFNQDGTLVKTDYYADETGFHAVGDHIPKAERR